MLQAELRDRFGIGFNQLLCITNMPVKRFADSLYKSVVMRPWRLDGGAGGGGGRVADYLPAGCLLLLLLTGPESCRSTWSCWCAASTR